MDLGLAPLPACPVPSQPALSLPSLEAAWLNQSSLRISARLLSIPVRPQLSGLVRESCVKGLRSQRHT